MDLFIYSFIKVCSPELISAVGTLLILLKRENIYCDYVLVRY
jgi:hypothetical protein